MKVTLIDHMGSDLSVVNAARVSFAKESQEFSSADAKLIKYLAAHNHWTVFGHCFATFRVKAPIFVARQLAKHQVGLVWNEESRRYIDSEPEFWFPKVWRGRPEGSIKQGSAGEVKEVNIRNYGVVPTGCAVEEFTPVALSLYNDLLASGVAPEQARMVLPLNTMTEWIWSGSLAAWARVCKLRLDPHAQVETREIAGIIDSHLGNLFPVSWKELMNGT